MRVRLALSAVTLAAIVAGGFEPFYLRVFALDGARYRAFATELPYRKLPGFRRFLLEVDRTTPPGVRIAIALPYREWEGGYGYGYYRASFLLPGKQVVPLLQPGRDVPAPANIGGADYVACWHIAPSSRAFQLVWRSRDGMLLRPLK
jgi:hypothetical protein